MWDMFECAHALVALLDFVVWEEAGFNVEGKKEAQHMVVAAPEHAVVELLAKGFELEPMKAGVWQVGASEARDILQSFAVSSVPTTLQESLWRK